jgi:hypothetical protein
VISVSLASGGAVPATGAFERTKPATDAAIPQAAAPVALSEPSSGGSGSKANDDRPAGRRLLGVQMA